MKKSNKDNQIIVIPINQPTNNSNPTNDMALKYL
jgi:hypothetical protein